MLGTETDTKTNEVYSHMRKAGESRNTPTRVCIYKYLSLPEQGDSFRIISPALPFAIRYYIQLAFWQQLAGLEVPLVAVEQGPVLMTTMVS